MQVQFEIILNASQLCRMDLCNACSLIIEPEPTENAGWDEDCNVQWSLDSYPDDVAEMLLDHDDNSSDDELDIIEDDDLDESDEDENFTDSF